MNKPLTEQEVRLNMRQLASDMKKGAKLRRQGFYSHFGYLNEISADANKYESSLVSCALGALQEGSIGVTDGWCPNLMEGMFPVLNVRFPMKQYIPGTFTLEGWITYLNDTKRFSREKIAEIIRHMSYRKNLFGEMK